MRTTSYNNRILWAALVVIMSAYPVRAGETFPLTKAVWQRLQNLRKDERFYVYCYAGSGPAATLPAEITTANELEGKNFFVSDCSGETAIVPEHLFQLGFMYCKREALKPDWIKIEKAFSKCLPTSKM